MMFCPLPQHTYCIQQPSASPADTYTSSRHLYAPSLRDSAKRRPSQLPEVELLPFPCEFTTNTPVCDVKVCVLYLGFFSHLMAPLRSAANRSGSCRKPTLFTFLSLFSLLCSAEKMFPHHKSSSDYKKWFVGLLALIQNTAG